jgi:hypothetical protein
MQRLLWVLLGWSSDYGAAVTAVAVLGIDTSDETTETFVEWIPREHEAGRIWRERLAGADSVSLIERMQFWAETTVASAAKVEPIVPDALLGDAVRAQVDDLLGSAR